jgi:lipopolysaccharide transport system ATP-binding protein
MAPVIEVNRVSKKFRLGDYHASLRELVPALAKRFVRRATEGRLERQEFWALREVDFKIEQGDTVAIIGHNGAGKSTMLKHLTGVLLPTEGQIITRGRVSALIEVAAGFHPMLTGRENIFLNGVILGMSIKEIRRKFDEIVAFSGLEEFLDTPVRRYSSGMYARLGFSVAAHLDPEILLIDEVLSVGDYSFQHKGIEKMKSIAASGATVMFVSHNMRSVQALCRRALMLDHGRLVMDGPTDDVTKGYLDAGRARLALEHDPESPCVVENVTLTRASGPTAVLESGEAFTVEGTVRFLRDCRESDILIVIYDAARVQASNVSLRRLGWDNANFSAGQSVHFKLSGEAHLVAGGYEIMVSVRDLARSREIAAMGTPIMFLVQATSGVRGVANVRPKIESISVEGTTADPVAGGPKRLAQAGNAA